MLCTHTLPSAASFTKAVLATTSLGSRFTTEVSAGASHGNTVSQPAALPATPVTVRATPVAPAGRPGTPSVDTLVGVPGTSAPTTLLTPLAKRVSASRAGATGVSLPVADGDV